MKKTKPLTPKTAPKKLACAVAALMTATIAQTAAANDYQTIGDLEIYSKPEGGSVVMTMMLDVSGSMGLNFLRNDYGEVCTYSWGSISNYTEPRVSVPFTDANGNPVSGTPTYTYRMRGCVYNGVAYYDRLSRLKKAVIELLADGTALPESYKIGIGTYPRGGTAAYLQGVMRIPARPLTTAHRLELMNFVAGLSAGGGTPSAAAYAEVGAYMLGTTTAKGQNQSGFQYSSASTKNGSVYASPITGSAGECDGYGIYFLTDGEPNYNNPTRISGAMADSLRRSTFASSSALSTWGAADGTTSGWQYIGPYAQALVSGNNPLGVPIKTATVGFGSVFASSPHLNASTGKIGNCTLLSSRDAINLCLWGQELGQGGFIATQNPEILKNNIVEFAGSLSTDIPASPAGTIAVPSDPLSANNIQPYAYLPMIQPEVAKNLTTWEGNLKKYHTLQGSLFGKNRVHLYQTSNNATAQNRTFPSMINSQAQDLWQRQSAQVNSLVTVGGSREQLPAPRVNYKGNTRSVYLETVRGGQKTLQKVGVGSSGRLEGFDQLGSEYSGLDMAYVLNWLGFGVSVDALSYTGNRANQLSALQNQLNGATYTGAKTMGGVLHSVPVLAAYSGDFDLVTGNITSDESKRDDHLLYGTMEGALHMVQAKDGEEVFSFIPRAVFDDTDQRHALLPESTYAAIGQPKFGVDAPWTTDASYTYSNTDMQAKKMYAYGGLRMGGVGFYGLNITNKANPSLAFAINDKTEGFERLGQTWAKPLIANIKTGPAITDTKKVLIFGGGYDMCYENPLFKLGDATNKDAKCANLTQTKGNAVYMVDAENGKLLQSWTATGGSDDRRHMQHSIVGEIVGRDRNNNGAVDHLYFSDLGGQIFRIDLKEGEAATSRNMTRQVVRVFDANAGITRADHIPYRFYEKPAVSIHNMGAGRVAMIAISSGDRSSPVHKRRSLQDANRIYGIVDRDVTTQRAITGRDLVSKNLTTQDLNFYDTAAIASASDATRRQYITDLADGKKQGWYYTMTRFDTYESVPNLKAVGSSMTMGNIYYTSVYNPDYNYTRGASCQAQILGGTERQMFCMPWGICAHVSTGKLVDGSKNGTLGFIKAGPGLQEMAIATITNTEGKSTNYTGFINQQTIAQQREAARNYNASGAAAGANAMGDTSRFTTAGANPSPSASPIMAENIVFQMKRWYDLQNAEGVN